MKLEISILQMKKPRLRDFKQYHLPKVSRQEVVKLELKAR